MNWTKYKTEHGKSTYWSGAYCIRSDGFNGWVLYYNDAFIKDYASVASAKRAAESLAMRNEAAEQEE